jgi:hypothetical protein
MATPSSLFRTPRVKTLRVECCCVGNVASDLRCVNAHVSLRSSTVDRLHAGADLVAMASNQRVALPDLIAF